MCYYGDEILLEPSHFGYEDEAVLVPICGVCVSVECMCKVCVVIHNVKNTNTPTPIAGWSILELRLFL